MDSDVVVVDVDPDVVDVDDAEDELDELFDDELFEDEDAVDFLSDPPHATTSVRSAVRRTTVAARGSSECMVRAG